MKNGQNMALRETQKKGGTAIRSLQKELCRIRRKETYLKYVYATGMPKTIPDWLHYLWMESNVKEEKTRQDPAPPSI